MDKVSRTKSLVEEKFTFSQRIEFLSNFASNVISLLSKYLIRNIGYAATATLLSREIKELGRRDARNFMQLLQLDKNKVESASQVLRIAAFLLGIELNTKNGETCVVKCPYGESVRMVGEPFICNICLNYCNGIVKEMLGPNFSLERTEWMLKNKKFCIFKIEKKV